MKKNNPISRRFPILAFGTFFIMYMMFCFVVNGDSMSPTYHNGQIVVINRFASTYECGEIIIVKTEEKSFLFKDKLIKRIVGMPGDTVSISDGTLYVNGIASRYISEEIIDAGVVEYPIILSEGKYFVIGDNVNESKDSRYIGPIDERDIIGRVIGTQKNR